MKKIKLMADYECYPLWYNSGYEVGNIDPDWLPISSSLKLELEKWAEQYDSTLNMKDPARSGFQSKESEIRFRKAGHLLRDKLQLELGAEYEVTYQE